MLLKKICTKKKNKKILPCYFFYTILDIAKIKIETFPCFQFISSHRDNKSITWVITSIDIDEFVNKKKKKTKGKKWKKKKGNFSFF